MKATFRATATAATLGLVLTLTPTLATAQTPAPIEKQTTFTYDCRLDDALSGNNKQDVSLSPETVTATFPKIVRAGEEFTVVLQPGSWKTTAELGRIRYDIALPQNATITKLELVNQGKNLVARGAKASVIRVNADGQPDPKGQFARISGDNLTIDNSPLKNDGNNSPTGLGAASGTTFQLPGIAITMTAPKQTGTIITTGLRNAGRKGSVETLSLLEHQKGTWWGWNNDGVYCNAGAEAQQISRTVVGPIDSTTAFTTTDPISLTWENPQVQNGNLQVGVATAEGDPINDGEVEFVIGDTTQRAAVVNGTAELDGFSFPAPEGREPAVHTVTARYVGIDGIYRTSATTNNVTVTVAPKVLTELYNRVALTATADYDRVTADTVPVTLSAAVTNDEGEVLPEDLTVTFYNGDEELGQATVLNGVATLNTEVPNTKQTHSFTATSADHITDTSHFNPATGKTELSITPVSKTSVELGFNASSAALGSTVPLEATYTATNGTVAGVEIAFRRNGIRIGTAITGDDGIARLEHQLTQAGTLNFTAFVPERSDDERRYTSAESESKSLTVAGAQSHSSETKLARTLPTSDAPLVAGDEAEFTASVDTSGITVDGTVSFYAGDSLLGTTSLDPASATASFRHTFTSAGEFSIRAVFNGGERKEGNVTTDSVAASESQPIELTVVPRDINVSTPGGNTEGTNDSSLSGGAGSFLQTIVDFFTQGPLSAIFSKIVSAITSFFSGFAHSGSSRS